MSFRFLTAGESHGKALVGIIDGFPSGVSIDKEEFFKQMKRRKMGYGRGGRQKIETDEVEFLAGVRHGSTLGSPISMAVWNRDWPNWQDIMDSDPFTGEQIRRQVKVPRPGHADYLGGVKYGHLDDMRNVLERSSARETAMRVAVGTVARMFLTQLGIDVASRVIQIGPIVDETPMPQSMLGLNDILDQNPVRCLDSLASEKMVQYIDDIKKSGDTIGGTFEVYAEGVPLALGSYSQWDRRFEGQLGQAFLSMNAFKSVELGIGKNAGLVKGSEAHDAFYPGKQHAEKLEYKTNHSGGITGGMTTGQTLVIRASMKPIATLMKPLDSVNLQSKVAEKAHVERSDYCAVPAAAVIGESLMCIELAKAILEKFGGDSLLEIKERVDLWNQRTK